MTCQTSARCCGGCSSTPTPLMAGTAAAGDPIAVLPVLFHLLWRGVLAVDVSVPLHQDTVARCGAAGR